MSSVVLLTAHSCRNGDGGKQMSPSRLDPKTILEIQMSWAPGTKWRSMLLCFGSRHVRWIADNINPTKTRNHIISADTSQFFRSPELQCYMK